MKTFKSYDQLWNRYVENKSFKGQLTARKILDGRAYGPDGWENFEMTSELSASVVYDIADTIGGRKKDLVRNRLHYWKVTHWALDRLILNKRSDNTYYWSYCAGQDYPGELGELRRYLYSL